jgi:hypothetical protein
MRGYRRKSGKHSSVESFSMEEDSPSRLSHYREDVVVISPNDKESPRISRKRPLSSSSSECSQNKSSPSSSALWSTPPRSVSDYLTRNDIEYSDWDIDHEDNDMTRIRDNMSWNSEVSTELSVGDDLVYVNDFIIDHESAQDGELTQAQLHNMVAHNENFTSANAIELLEREYSFDWASNYLDYEPNSYDDVYDLWKCDNFFDYISIKGLPFKPVSHSSSSIIELTTFTFDKWYTPYRNTKAQSDTSGVSILGRSVFARFISRAATL